MQVFSCQPKTMLTGLWHNRALIQALVKREVQARYRGSLFGLLWSFFTPLLMLAVYTFVFSAVFKARWGGTNESKTEFALILFAGLIVFHLFAECITRAPSLILQNVNYVKKVVFPLEILPFVSLISALFHGAVSLLVWLAAYVILFGVPPSTVVYLPLVLLPYFLFIMGLSWMLAAIGVYLRDISQLVGVLTTMLMFLSPIFYPVTALPEPYRFFIYLNPLTTVIEQVRGILYFGQAPNLLEISIYSAIAFVIAWSGFFLFQKTRKGFADVL